MAARKSTPTKSRPAARVKPVKVTAVVYIPGDQSVGIPDGSVRLDYGTWGSYANFFASLGGRENYRTTMREFMNDCHAECGGVGIFFGDECQNCGHELRDCGCRF